MTKTNPKSCRRTGRWNPPKKYVPRDFNCGATAVLNLLAGLSAVEGCGDGATGA